MQVSITPIPLTHNSSPSPYMSHKGLLTCTVRNSSCQQTFSSLIIVITATVNGSLVCCGYRFTGSAPCLCATPTGNSTCTPFMPFCPLWNYNWKINVATLKISLSYLIIYSIYWWRKSEYLEKTTDLSPVVDYNFLTFCCME